jgi:hypothetical protein
MIENSRTVALVKVQLAKFFGVPTFFNYAIADGLYNLLSPDKTGIKIAPKNKSPDFQLIFNFCDEVG